MKAKKALKDTAFYGLVVPTAAVLDTAITATVHIGAALVSTARAPYASYRGMKAARQILSQGR